MSIVFKLQHGRYFIGLILFLAYFVTTKHNLTFHPHYQVWMCNLTALFSLILVFKFSQNLFDITFFFAWTGDIFTFFIPNNQTLPDIYDFPLVWVAYWLKHIAPLCLTIYLLTVQGERLSGNGMKKAFSAMMFYAIMMAGYNLVFNQNILDLCYPTVDIEKSFGSWPFYIIIDMAIVYLWFLGNNVVARWLGFIKG